MKRKSLPTGRDFLFVEGYGNENPGAFQSPRPLRGATCLGVTRAHYIKFQSTRPLRGATTFFTSHNSFIKISTHAPLAGRDFIKHSLLANISISTHAPLAGRDKVQPCKPRYGEISTHAPLAGRDSALPFRAYALVIFQSTRPLRGATGRPVHILPDILYFNPRAPCGARQQKCTNHYAHFCDNRQISDAFAQNAACQGILLFFDAGKPCGFWVRTAQVISARLCFAL